MGNSSLKPNLAHEVNKALAKDDGIGESLMLLANTGHWSIADIYQETIRQQSLGDENQEVHGEIIH